MINLIWYSLCSSASFRMLQKEICFINATLQIWLNYEYMTELYDMLCDMTNTGNAITTNNMLQFLFAMLLTKYHNFGHFGSSNNFAPASRFDLFLLICCSSHFTYKHLQHSHKLLKMQSVE